MPTREQSRARAKDERLQAHLQPDGNYIVYNPTSHSQYLVVKSPGGTWYCTCPFARKGSNAGTLNPCKHLVKVLVKVEGEVCNSCNEHSNDVRDGKCKQCRFYDRMGL